MASRTRSESRALRERALSLLARGTDVQEAAKAVGVSDRTVRRWRRPPAPSRRKARRQKSKAPREEEALTQMLRAECPAVCRVMLDMAKGGDVRAAALVVKLLGNTLASAEDGDDGDSETTFGDLERELSALPPAIASEIVGLLAQAESEAEGQGGGRGAPPGGGERRSMRLPWQEDGDPPDEGTDSL